MHPLRKSLKPPKERGKKVDSTLLDVKASTLQHVGQPYTVGRAGSTRNKETTEASVRKRFELAYVLENSLKLSCSLKKKIYVYIFFSLSFSFSFLFLLFYVRFIYFLIYLSVLHIVFTPFALCITPIRFVLRRQQGVEHCSSRDIVATVNKSVRVVEFYDRRKGTRSREDRKEHLLQDFLFVGAYLTRTSREMLFINRA